MKREILILTALAAFITLLIPPTPAYTQTVISKEMANAYYNSCLSKPDPRMKPETQAALCACTSAQMTEKMSVEDVQVMGQNNQAGRDKLNFMLINVYAPCMSFPVSDMVEDSCLKDEKISMMQLKGSRPALCHCMGTKTGTWFTGAGRQLMAEVLKKNQNISDPVSPVMDTPAFQKASYDNLVSCLNGNP